MKMSRNLDYLKKKIINTIGKSPEKIYINIEKLDIQLKIKEDNRHKSGIYMIYNLINDKSYIGSASNNRINVRFRNHIIHGTGSKLTNLAVKEYGLENFAFIVIEYFSVFVLKENFNKAHLSLLELETYYIEKFAPQYNILQIGGNSLGYRHTEETKYKMKVSKSKVELNKPFTAELLGSTTERKILLSKLVTLHNCNLELRNKLSKFTSKSVILYNHDGSIHSKYPSIRAMAKEFKCCNKTINKTLKLEKIFKNIGIIKLDR